MNIVIVSILLPYPLNSGGAQAQYNIIDELRKKHNITFIFPENGQNKMSAMKQLQELWPEVSFKPYRYATQLMDLRFFFSKAVRALKLKFIPNNERFQVERILKPYGYALNSRFSAFIRRTITSVQADVVQVEFYPFLPLVRYLPDSVKKIFIHHEIRYIRNERMLAGYSLTDAECRLRDDVKKNELDDLNRFDRVVTLTQTDKDILKDQGICVPIDVSPAAVNSELKSYKEWNGKITFLGGYGHAPNSEGVDWLIKSVLPLVNDKEQIQFEIIGKGWPHEYSISNEKYTVGMRGFVECLSDAVCGSIMVVPILSGSGMRMKILEAAALGVPFITTSVGVEGLKFSHLESCLIADTPEEFATALTSLMNSEELRQKLTENAAKVFEENYSVKSLSEIRNKVYYKEDVS